MRNAVIAAAALFAGGAAIAGPQLADFFQARAEVMSLEASLARQRAKGKEIEAEIERHVAAMERLLVKQAESDDTIATCESRLATAREAVSQLEEQLSTHQQEGRKLQQSIAAAQKSHLALSEEMKKMRAAMENVSASLQQMRQRADMAWSRLPGMTGGMEAERTLIDMAKGSKGSK